MPFNKSDIIFTYSRKEAIEDGEQTCVSDLYPSDCRLYKYPVYFTKSVMGLIGDRKDPGAIVWDIVFMSIKSSSRIKLNESTYQFGVIVENADRTPDFVEDGSNCYSLIVQVGATDFDDPAPAVTIMFPEDR